MDDSRHEADAYAWKVVVAVREHGADDLKGAVARLVKGQGKHVHVPVLADRVGVGGATTRVGRFCAQRACATRSFSQSVSQTAPIRQSSLATDHKYWPASCTYRPRSSG
jgi:hypothetical protein